MTSTIPQLKINLGSGYNRLDDTINIDNREIVKPDIVCDVTEGLPFYDNTVDTVLAFDFLEHIPIGKTIAVVEEIHRVLKPGGLFRSVTPSTDGRGAFQDPTHVSFWNCNSFWYYSSKDYRDLYGIKADFEIIGMENKIIGENPSIIHVFADLRKR